MLIKKCRNSDKKFEFFLFNVRARARPRPCFRTVSHLFLDGVAACLPPLQDMLAYASRPTPVSKWNLHRKIDISAFAARCSMTACVRSLNSACPRPRRQELPGQAHAVHRRHRPVLLPDHQHAALVRRLPVRAR
jgi:hypothetical protein